jgi:phenylalanyl-tRNA synthetase alpha subunit
VENDIRLYAADTIEEGLEIGYVAVLRTNVLAEVGDLEQVRFAWGCQRETEQLSAETAEPQR